MMMSFDWNSLQLVLPELFLVVVTMFLLIVGALKGNRVTPVIMMGALAAVAFAIYMVTLLPIEPRTGFDDMIVSNGFTIIAKAIMLVALFLVMVITTPWLFSQKEQAFEFPLVMILAVIGMMLMVSANDFLSVYLALELSSLSLYILAAFSRDSLRSSEAGLKYFILGAIASGMLLFGISLVYGFAGSTDFKALATMMSEADFVANAGLVVGLVFVLVGFCFKVSAVPFHMWTPDVYEGAPTPVTAFFATAPKVAALILFAQVLMGPFAALIIHWQQVLIVIAIASMAVGAFGALTQNNIKRLLAYSSIGHVGFALVGLAAGSSEGLQGVMIYMALYIFMSVGAFACVLLMRQNGEWIENIGSLSGLSRQQPLVAAAFGLFLFSMAGIPPLAGFFGKMYVFLAAVNAELYTLAVVGVVTSVISAFYYLKIIKIMYFDEVKDGFDPGMPVGTRYVMILCSVVTLLFVLFPTPLIQVAEMAALAVVS